MQGRARRGGQRACVRLEAFGQPNVNMDVRE